MYKMTIDYEDFDGNQRTEDCYFNLTKSKLLEMEMSKEGGLEKYITKIINTQDSPKIMEMFKEIIRESYGEKSDDGRRFIQSEEIFEKFSQTLAYDELFVKLATNADEAAKFINGIIPKDLAEQLKSDSKVLSFNNGTPNV